MKTGIAVKPEKVLIIFLCVLLTVFCGCSNSEKIPTTPLEKLERDANALISEGDYPGAVEVYAKALDDEALHRDVLIKIEKTYRDWMLEKAKDINTTMDDLLRIPEELNRRFPESVEYAEKLMSNICSSYLSRGLEKGIDQMEAVKDVLTERYKNNENISKTINVAADNLVYTLLTTILREFVIEQLPEKLDNEEFSAIFKLLDDKNIMEICEKSEKYKFFPVYSWVKDETTMLLDYKDSTLVIRMGFHDDEWMLEQDGASICYRMDPQDNSIYTRQIVYGYFDKGIINGKFVELMEVSGLHHITGRTDGTMKENLFDGTVTGEFTVDDMEVSGSITFKEGVPVSLGKVSKDGITYDVVSRDENHDILYSNEEMNSLHGMMPDYRISY